jgi:hypothetical protein
MESGQSSSEPQKARGFIQRMNEEIKTEMDDELRPEYDLPKLLKDGVRGKYAERYQVWIKRIQAQKLDPNYENLDIELEHVNVFLGPNNSGKTRLIEKLWQRAAEDIRRAGQNDARPIMMV